MNPDSFDTSDQSATVSNQSPPPQAPTQDTSQPSTQPTQNGPQTQNQPQGTIPGGTPTSPPSQTQPAGPTAQSIAPTQATSNPQSSSNTVSNAPTPQTHPAILRAGILHSIGATLAGGERYKTTVDPVTGETTRTPIPLTSGQIGMAIALEAISGSLSGLAERGPGATGRAALAGFNQQAQAQAQRQQAQEQQAQQDAKNKSDALMRQAQSFEQNSRTILNTAQAQRMGVESLKDSVAANEKLLSDYSDEGAVQDQNVSEDELKAGMANGKYDSTKQIAIPDGFTNINGHYEQTFSVVSNPSAKVPLSNDQVQEFAAAGIPGFLPYRDGTKIVDDFRVPGTIVARANAQLQALNLMKQDAQTVQDTLAQSNDKDNQALAASIPDLQTLLDDPKRGAGLFGALQRFQKYTSHSDQHGMDFAESLAQMASPSKPELNNPKQVVPNQDAPFAQTIYGAFGNGDPVKGKAILDAYHNEITPEPIKNADEATSIIANNQPGSKAYRIAQKWLQVDVANKSAIARAGAQARQDAKPVPATPATLTTPDALGFVPNVSDVKEYNKRQDSFKKNADALATTEGSYQQFQNALASINQGNFTGAQSVVALFDSIGLSATPLAGKGFRVNQNTIAEHANARGWEQALQQKLLSAKSGDIITPQQVKDYASIANQARISQYINLVNQVHNSGLNANFVLPTGNGQKIDPGTAKIFLTLAGNNPQVARQAATAKGWQF